MSCSWKKQSSQSTSEKSKKLSTENSSVETTPVVVLENGKSSKKAWWVLSNSSSLRKLGLKAAASMQYSICSILKFKPPKVSTDKYLYITTEQHPKIK
uniref:Uncharacterized protein n=1 Tax=Rhizophora mucronata TaxID=61149 RepID=A0A2P2L4Y7_RHIMU